MPVAYILTGFSVLETEFATGDNCTLFINFLLLVVWKNREFYANICTTHSDWVY